MTYEEISQIKAITMLENEIREIDKQKTELVSLITKLYTAQERTYTSNCDGSEYVGVLVGKHDIDVLERYDVSIAEIKKLSGKKYLKELWVDCIDYIYMES